MAGRRQLQVSLPVWACLPSDTAPLKGIIPVIWSWRNCFYLNDLPDFSAEGAGNWRPATFGRRIGRLVEAAIARVGVLVAACVVRSQGRAGGVTEACRV
jgi:hypothetical protein